MPYLLCHCILTLIPILHFHLVVLPAGIVHAWTLPLTPGSFLCWVVYFAYYLAAICTICTHTPPVLLPLPVCVHAIPHCILVIVGPAPCPSSTCLCVLPLPLPHALLPWDPNAQCLLPITCICVVTCTHFPPYLLICPLPCSTYFLPVTLPLVLFVSQGLTFTTGCCSTPCPPLPCWFIVACPCCPSFYWTIYYALPSTPIPRLHAVLVALAVAGRARCYAVCRVVRCDYFPYTGVLFTPVPYCCRFAVPYLMVAPAFARIVCSSAAPALLTLAEFAAAFRRMNVTMGPACPRRTTYPSNFALAFCITSDHYLLCTWFVDLHSSAAHSLPIVCRPLPPPFTACGTPVDITRRAPTPRALYLLRCADRTRCPLRLRPNHTMLYWVLTLRWWWCPLLPLLRLPALVVLKHNITTLPWIPYFPMLCPMPLQLL